MKFTDSRTNIVAICYNVEQAQHGQTTPLNRTADLIVTFTKLLK